MGSDEQNERDRDLANRMERMRALNFSFDGLLRQAAEDQRFATVMEDAYERQSILLTVLESTLSYVSASLPPLLAKEVSEKINKAKSDSAKEAINARHDQPNGSREKRAEIQKIWGSGQYKTRDECVEDVSRYLGMKLSTARKALQGTPNPNPWPAKDVKK